MSNPLTMALPQLRQQEANRMKQAFTAALVLESAALLGAFTWVATHPHVPPAALVALQIEAPSLPEPELPKPKLEPVKPPPKPVVEAVKKVALPPPPVPVPVSAPLPVAAAPSENPVPAPSPVPSVAAPVFKAAPPAPPGPAKPSNEYLDKVRNAVQNAFVYPPAARAMEFRGRARVAFKLLDGQASNVRVLVRSGLGMGDRAALEAVQNAVFPAPAVELKGVDMDCEIWVELR
jgi:TonB family protein